VIAEELGELLGVRMNPAAQNQSVRCPLHDDRVASMSISLPKGVWYCWGCGKGGRLSTLARFLGGSLNDLDLLLATVNTEPDEEQVDFIDKYNEFKPIQPTTAEAITYAREKKIPYTVLEDFGTRYSDSGTLVFPYFDGVRVVALRYRSRDNKKWYESGSERTIYNLNGVRGAQRVILSEGESDTHSLYAMCERLHLDVRVGGIPGANSSVEKWELWALDMMWADVVYIAFDADDAGDKGADRAIQVLGDKAVRLRPTLATDWSDAIIAGETPNLEV
jgi:hypothetical protein